MNTNKNKSQETASDSRIKGNYKKAQLANLLRDIIRQELQKVLDGGGCSFQKVLRTINRIEKSRDGKLGED
jgi:hypothetical protein